VEGETNLGRNRNTQEVNKPNVLVPHNLDLINKTKAAQLVPQLLFSHALFESTEVDVPARIALADGERHLRRDRRRFAPANFELLTVQRQLFNSSIGVEGRGDSTVKEGKENARLFGENANGLQRTKVDEVQQLVNRGSGREVTNIDRTPSRI
jgi:hypothetical protein